MRKFFPILFIYILLFLSFYQANGQIKIRGTVYDSLGVIPIQSVSVMTSSGGGTVTDKNGHYSIETRETDSIWFSYLNKPTRKFAVKDIANPFAFDISIQMFIHTLPEVRARTRDYKLDSMLNRESYAKIFNFQKPGLAIASGSGSVGFDLDELINAFRFRRTRNLQSFQRRLITQEQDAFVKHRFSKALIRRITQMDNDSLINEFIAVYQPSYLFTARANDYDFHQYIKASYARFVLGRRPPPLWKEGEINDDY